MGAFREALEENGLFDLGCRGNGFTWCNQHADSSFTRERLDREVANGVWISKFNLTIVENMVARTSDHSPMLLKMLEGTQGVRRRVRLFKYEAKWAMMEGCDQVVEGVWRERGSGLLMQRIQRVLITCSGALVRWSKMKEKEEGKTLKERTVQLEELYSREGPQDVRRVKLLREEVGRLLEQENLKWKQRAKKDWLLLRDGNTKFFHACATQQRRKNEIKHVCDEDGRERVGHEEVASVFKKYFETVYKSNNPSDEVISGCLDSMSGKVSPSMNEKLMRVFSKEEIKATVF
ncbi:uncharacterized protein LOC122281421 [Carya illinoinensis]|uniref:uncharacterized protein LOC122281421 n=1 Tax=Carya illinoinensis TaxID=32201 RepID=UPI001C7242D8|nr:uncharacterized protein LOC122281421 [Carya illinoinensis]